MAAGRAADAQQGPWRHRAGWLTGGRVGVRVRGRTCSAWVPVCTSTDLTHTTRQTSCGSNRQNCDHWWSGIQQSIDHCIRWLRRRAHAPRTCMGAVPWFARPSPGPQPGASAAAVHAAAAACAAASCRGAGSHRAAVVVRGEAGCLLRSAKAQQHHAQPARARHLTPDQPQFPNLPGGGSQGGARDCCRWQQSSGGDSSPPLAAYAPSKVEPPPPTNTNIRTHTDTPTAH
jgi:hypothetical protein